MRPPSRPPVDPRRIAHVDLDAFFAAVEQRDNRALRGRPLAVGGRRHGVVMAASYEARPFGVHSALPVAEARRRCPDLLIVRPRMDVYRDVSETFHDALAPFAPLRDRVGLDEAYLDLSHHPPTAERVGAALRAAVRRATGLTCSVGVSTSRFVAKVASDHRKPDGLTVVRPSRVRAFLAGLPIERFHGVGPASTRKLHALGVRTGADLQRTDPDRLVAHFGRFGGRLARLAVGDDNRPVGAPRERKSVGAERTYVPPLTAPDDVAAALAELGDRVARRLAAQGLVAETVTVKGRSPAFDTLTRQRTLEAPVWTAADLAAEAALLLSAPEPLHAAYRLLGITASHLRPGSGLVVARQLTFPWAAAPSGAAFAVPSPSAGHP